MPDLTSSYEAVWPFADRTTDDEPAPDDVAWNDVEHDERCCMDGSFRSPSPYCPGVEELFRIEREDPSL